MSEASRPNLPPGRPRRTLALALATGVLAAAGGAAWRLWRDPAGPSGLAGPSAPTTPLSAADLDRFWSLSFEQPTGGTLNLASLRGRPLVLNFWATWCPPCIEELPEIDRFHRAWSGRGWQVLGLAVDRPGPVRDYLARQPLSFAVGLAGLAGTELSRTLGNATGALPFTAVFDAKGDLRQRKSGQTNQSELETWASKI